MQQAFGNVLDVAVFAQAGMEVGTRWRALADEHVVEKRAVAAERYCMPDNRAMQRHKERHVDGHMASACGARPADAYSLTSMLVPDTL